MKKNYAKLIALVMAVVIGNFLQAQCTNVTLTMNDSWGDGWNGGSISFTNQSTGTVYGPYSIGGSSGTQVICFPYGTYSYNQVAGTYPGEITWSLSNGVSGDGYSGSLSNAFTVTAPVSCSGTSVTLTMNDSWGDGWNGGGSITLSNDLGDTFGPYTISGASGTESLCLPDACYSISVNPGTYPGEMSWSLSNGTSGGGSYGSQSNVFTTGSGSCGAVTGCMDPTAANYNALATVDDGSCYYAVPSTGSNSFTTCSMTLYDNGGPSGNYANSSNGSTTIYPGVAGQYVQLSFASFNTESGFDYVYVYNGNSTAAAQVAGSPFTGTSLPSSITSSAADGSLTIQLTSDGSVNRAGFEATASCVSVVSGCMDPTASNYNPAATVDDGSCYYAVPSSGSNSFTTCSMTLYDNGGPSGNYANSSNGSTTIYPGVAGQYVQLSFSSFSVETCCDRLYIYDGNSTAAAQVPGSPFTSLPANITSSAADGSLTLRFTSDGSVTYSGFEATVSCLAPPSNPTGVTASASTICEGESTTLTASGASGTTYWFTGSCATSGEVGTGASISVSPTTTTTYYARNNNGAWSAGCASITISVDTAPAINAGVDQEVCEGASVTLAASGADSYSWDNGISDGIAFTPASTTTYTVTGTDANGCSNTDQVLVTVNSNPTVDAGADQTICSGSSASLSASVSPAGGSFSGGGVGFTDLSTTTSNITVSGTGMNASDIGYVMINIVHTWDADLDITLIAPDGSSIDLSSDNGGSGDNYTNTIFSSTGTTPITSGSAPFTGTYTPEAPFSGLTGSADGVWTLSIYDDASGDTGSLLDWNINFDDPNVYSWTPSATLSDAAITNPSATPTTTTTYTLSASLNGCSASDDVVISVDANPFAANAGEDKPACINNSATLSASNPPVGSGTWTWSPSAPTYAGGTSASDYNAQVVFNAVGQYTGTWTVTNGICTSTPDDAVVTVTSANNNASLFASAGAATESVFAFEVCEEGPWTYYAASGSPDEYLFAINKNGNSFSAVVSITDLPGTSSIASLGGNWQVRGTWLIGRYWNVSLFAGSITSPVDIRFFVDPAEVTQAENDATTFLNSVAAATNITPLTFFKTVSAAFDPATDLVNGEFTFAPVYLPYSTGTLNGVTYYELTGLTSFSGGTGGFSVNDSGSPLPVELLGFDVNAVDNQFIRLDWATASEINNEGFEVLRSTDGVNFERIAWIDGNGNSAEINEYVFNDWGVDKGMTYYYQLKQIDYDGQYEYFDIKSARLDGKTTFTVGALVPNPSKGNDIVSVDVSTSSGELLTVEIYDRIGAKVKSTSYVLFAAENALDINIADLAEGTYFLNFQSSMGTETRKLVVLK